jgi:hypothetical protein
LTITKLEEVEVAEVKDTISCKQYLFTAQNKCIFKDNQTGPEDLKGAKCEQLHQFNNRLTTSESG